MKDKFVILPSKQDYHTSFKNRSKDLSNIALEETTFNTRLLELPTQATLFLCTIIRTSFETKRTIIIINWKTESILTLCVKWNHVLSYMRQVTNILKTTRNTIIKHDLVFPTPCNRCNASWILKPNGAKHRVYYVSKLPWMLRPSNWIWKNLIVSLLCTSTKWRHYF